MKKEDAPGSLASTAPNKACKASKLTRRVKAGEQLTEDRRLRRKPERAWKEKPARPSHWERRDRTNFARITGRHCTPEPAQDLIDFKLPIVDLTPHTLET